MKNETTKALLIIVICTAFIVAVFTLIYRKMTKELFITKIAAYIQRMEGGLGRGLADNASSYPAPWTYQGKTGWHTNKGVTFRTFEANAKKLGYEVSPKNFFEMPDDIWWKIFQNAFLAQWNLSEIDHLPRIQAVIVTWAWNSGNGGAERLLANFQREKMGIVDSNITKAEIIQNFKKKVAPANEIEWFDKLCARRKEDYSKMSDFGTYGRGWYNAVDKFIKEFR